jgi:hypothetical protein
LIFHYHPERVGGLLTSTTAGLLVLLLLTCGLGRLIKRCTTLFGARLDLDRRWLRLLYLLLCLSLDRRSSGATRAAGASLGDEGQGNTGNHEEYRQDSCGSRQETSRTATTKYCSGKSATTTESARQTFTLSRLHQHNDNQANANKHM